jgi:amino acid adenylation domain-containing protein
MSTIEVGIQLNSVPIEDAYPLSRLQAGMLFHSAYSPETAIYHDIFTFHLRAPLDVQKLRASVREMCHRYPVLRTSFDLSEFSEPLQLVHEEVDPPLDVEDLRGLPNEEQEKAIREWAESERHRPFDFKQAPLFRVQLHRRSQETFQFSFSFHHAILDGWSVAVLLTALFEHYVGLLRNQRVDLPPVRPAAFQQFIALERQAIESAEQRKFWEDYLEGCTATSVPRWPVENRSEQTRRVEQYLVPLTPDLSDRLKLLVQSLGVHVKSALLTAHIRTMSLLCGTNDILTGLVANGRPEEEGGDRAVGLFLNTLPIRMCLSGGTWRELVRAVYESEQQLLPYRRFPLVEIQKIKGGRQLFDNAFYFVYFYITETLAGVEGLESLSAEFYEETNFTLMANFSLDTEKLQAHLRLIYDPKQLCAKQIELIGSYYVASLTDMARNPDGRYETASLLTDAEREQIVDGWNATHADYSQAQLTELIEKQAEQDPQAIALQCEEQRVTYRELNERANQLAWYLREQGVRPEVRVGVCLERSVEMLVGLVGIMKAGGAYLPLDPDYPAERLRYMLEDARPGMLLSSEPLLQRLADAGANNVLCFDRDCEAIRKQPVANLTPIGQPQNLAYMIYTSGSTGRPKGVMVTHQSLMNFLHSMTDTLGMRKGDLLAAVTTLSFDIAGLELYLPLVTGGQVLLISRETARDGHELHQKLVQYPVTLMQATPSTWSMLALDGWHPRSTFKILCGGEALNRELAVEMLAHGVPVWNLYGPTETTIWSCVKQLKDSQAITIGGPIANTQVLVLDQHQQLAPIGVAGELYIGGTGVARGYFHMPDLTAERFVPNPFSKVSGDRMYRTGDVARFRPDGELEFLGRVDQQVKIRGFRIELGEIEAALNANQAVSQAVVIARPGATGEKQLVAYLVPKEAAGQTERKDSTLTTSSLREYLMTRLPEYMVPSLYVILTQMPLTPNNKVDRKRLPEPDPNLRPEDRVYIAPRTKIEETIAGIWTELLGIEKVSINDSFFEIGGDSLLVSRLVAKIHALFDVNLPIKTIFLTPTIQNIAVAVKTQRAQRKDHSYVEDFLDDLSDDQIDALLRETLCISELAKNQARS